MLLMLRNYTLASPFRLKHSLPVATRHVSTTSPNLSPAQAQKTGEKPAQKTGEKPAQKTGVKPKPHRILLKDLKPPIKKPLSSFVSFTLEKAKQHKDSMKTPVPFSVTLRESSAAWSKLSDAEKLPYATPPGALKEHNAYLKGWHAGLSDEAKKALKMRRRRKVGTGYSLFVSETFKDAKGESLGEKSADLAVRWRTFSAEQKAEYSKRAAEAPFGVMARRVAQRAREKEWAAKAEKKAAEKKEKQKKLAAIKKLKATEKKEKQKMLAAVKRLKAMEKKSADVKKSLDARKKLANAKKIIADSKKKIAGMKKPDAKKPDAKKKLAAKKTPGKENEKVKGVTKAKA